MLRSLPTGPPVAIFHAVDTRDGEARVRDGQPVYAVRRLSTDVRGQAIYEVRFGDGFWMLATESDVQITQDG